MKPTLTMLLLTAVIACGDFDDTEIPVAALPDADPPVEQLEQSLSENLCRSARFE